ncbi:hypothetical protein BJ684DRAFT_14639 [Piptocephalis cylindrospora]|uniref:Uncharacterized protein n=1 Tax=Piptocephalis cylindrospora TaxID=1907219 RepID=A0A4P9Y9H2_9FUNG|nr:hypothetical protein BJ684DRAFT_14639 [Piptocephalis cylindrospora]|eukprot:RKP15071.1 hypothetical protein BJ684DRAFT_14639 [Piptocephalis cylindrospora]
MTYPYRLDGRLRQPIFLNGVFFSISLALLTGITVPRSNAQVLTTNGGVISNGNEQFGNQQMGTMGGSNGNVVMAPVGSTPIVTTPATVVSSNGGGNSSEGSNVSRQVVPVMAVSGNSNGHGAGNNNGNNGMGMQNNGGDQQGHDQGQFHGQEHGSSEGNTTLGIGLGIMGAVLAIIGMAAIVSFWFYRRRRRQHIGSNETGDRGLKNGGGFSTPAKGNNDPYAEEGDRRHTPTPPSYPSHQVEAWQHATEPRYPDPVQADHDSNPDNGSNGDTNSRPSSAALNTTASPARRPMEDLHYFPHPPAPGTY